MTGIEAVERPQAKERPALKAGESRRVHVKVV